MAEELGINTYEDIEFIIPGEGVPDMYDGVNGEEVYGSRDEQGETKSKSEEDLMREVREAKSENLLGDEYRKNFLARRMAAIGLKYAA